MIPWVIAALVLCVIIVLLIALILAAGFNAVINGALEPPEDDQWPDT